MNENVNAITSPTLLRGYVENVGATDGTLGATFALDIFYGNLGEEVYAGIIPLLAEKLDNPNDENAIYIDYLVAHLPLQVIADVIEEYIKPLEDKNV